jgi:hypothetical protein
LAILRIVAAPQLPDGKSLLDGLVEQMRRHGEDSPFRPLDVVSFRREGGLAVRGVAAGRGGVRAGRVGFGPVSAAERRALNENVFREMNERLERLGEEFGGDAVEFLCECADSACSDPLSIQVSLH